MWTLGRPRPSWTHSEGAVVTQELKKKKNRQEWLLRPRSLPEVTLPPLHHVCCLHLHGNHPPPQQAHCGVKVFKFYACFPPSYVSSLSAFLSRQRAPRPHCWCCGARLAASTVFTHTHRARLKTHGSSHVDSDKLLCGSPGLHP